MLRPTKRLPRPSELSALKLLLVVGYLAWDHQAVSGRVASLGISPALAAYVALYALLAAALAAAAFIPRHDVRVGFATLLAAGSILLHGYEWTTGAPLTYDGFETMLASSGAADEAAGQHAGCLLYTFEPTRP